MSDNIFSHTSSAGVTTSITFDTAARLIADPDTLSFNDELGTSKGGTDYVREYGDDQNRFAFSFIVPRTKAETEADMADAKAFFAVVKRTGTFTWTDENGTVRTVRNMSNQITFEPMGGRWVRCSIELKEQ